MLLLILAVFCLSLPVMQADRHRCTSSTFAELTAPEGLIGSVVTQETDCGSYRSPWLIHALPGQRVNISLVDFGQLQDGSEGGHSACVAYASFREQGNSRPHTLCSGQTSVYTSKSHMVEVIIQGTHKNERFFLLKYKGQLPSCLMSHSCSIFPLCSNLLLFLSLLSLCFTIA